MLLCNISKLPLDFIAVGGLIPFTLGNKKIEGDIIYSSTQMTCPKKLIFITKKGLIKIVDTNKPSPKKTPNIKLKKGQTINDLIIQARKMVEEKLSHYKDVSECITNIFDLKTFFDISLYPYFFDKQ